MSVANLGIDPDRPPQDAWSGDRTAPHDLLAEQSTLGGMLLSRDGTEVDEVMGVLHPRDFYIPKHEIIAIAIGKLRTAGLPTDVIAVTDELTKSGQLQRAGSAEYLHTLTGLVPTAANAGFYASIVAEKAVLRRLVEAGTRIVQMGYASEGDVSELAANALAEVEAIERPEQRTIRQIGDGLNALAAALEEKPDQLPTPWTSLDTEIGGFGQGELVIIAARPGDGKSIVLQQIAMRAAKIGTVAYVSLEMSEAEMQMRMVANYGEINVTTLRNHTLSKSDWTRFAEAKRTTSGAPVYVDDHPAATIASIRAHALAVARRGPLAMVVVDYLQLVDGPGSDRRTIVDGVSRGLKKLAKTLRVPVVAAAQLNRGERGRGGSRPAPTLRDLREAGGIEQDADLVILLHRDPDKRQAEIDFILAKSRHSGLGKFRMRWQPHYARVLDLEWSPSFFGREEVQ